VLQRRPRPSDCSEPARHAPSVGWLAHFHRPARLRYFAVHIPGACAMLQARVLPRRAGCVRGMYESFRSRRDAASRLFLQHTRVQGQRCVGGAWPHCAQMQPACSTPSPAWRRHCLKGYFYRVVASGGRGPARGPATASPSAPPASLTSRAPASRHQPSRFPAPPRVSGDHSP
jgi:hypothetical protein